MDTCLDSAVQLRLEGGEDVDAVLEVALVHRLLRPPHRHEQRATDQRVLLGPSLARLPPEKYGSKVTGTVFKSLFNIQNQFQRVFEPPKRHHLKPCLSNWNLKASWSELIGNLKFGDFSGVVQLISDDDQAKK